MISHTTSQKSYINPITGKGPYWQAPSPDKKNILMICMDMVPWEFYGGLKDSRVDIKSTYFAPEHPDFVNFNNSFCSSPLCAPSRLSILTGRYPYVTVNGERMRDGNTAHARDEDIFFPEYLKETGYHTRHVGKCHVGAKKFIDVFSENASPWDRWSPPWNDDDQYIQFLNDKGYDRMTFNRVIYGENASGKGQGNFYGGWISPQNGKEFTKDATYPAYLVQKAISTLNTRQDPQKPFYLQLDFFGPHQPFAIPAGMEEREKEIRAQLKLPESWQNLRSRDFEAGTDEPRVYKMYRKNWGLKKEETLLDYMTANLLQFELIDSLLENLFQYLKQQNLYEDTWIYLIADHGEMNGEMALIDKGAYLNPLVMRTPLLVKPPKSASIETGRSIEAPVSLLDIAPTILEATGIATDARLDGVSLLDTMTGKQRPDSKPILFDIWSHVIPNPCIGMIFQASDQKSYLFSFNTVDETDELYLLNRKKEIKNLFFNEKHTPIVQEAIGLMDQRLASDARWNCYSGFFRLKYAETLCRENVDNQKFI